MTASQFGEQCTAHETGSNPSTDQCKKLTCIYNNLNAIQYLGNVVTQNWSHGGMRHYDYLFQISFYNLLIMVLYFSDKKKSYQIWQLRMFRSRLSHTFVKHSGPVYHIHKIEDNFSRFWCTPDVFREQACIEKICTPYIQRT